MSVYEEVCAKNPHLDILELAPESYSAYGRILDAAKYAELFRKLAATPVPAAGNVYVPAAEELETKPALIALSDEFYVGVHAQIGYCNGNSHKVNCMEYHDHEEIDLAGADLLLFLGRVEDMDRQSIATSQLRCFFVPAGTALTFATGTLHFAPCRVHSSGFRCGVILQRGTNAPIAADRRRVAYFAQSKWLIGHEESRQVKEMHALCGLTGENYEVFPID